MRTEERLHSHLRAAGRQIVVTPADPRNLRRGVITRRAVLITSAAAVAAVVVFGGMALWPERVQPVAGDAPIATQMTPDAGSPATSPPADASTGIGDVGGSNEDPAPGAGDSGAQSLWPPTDPGEAATCLRQYPEDLSTMPLAFDGTIVGVRRGTYDKEAGGTPVDLELVVNQVFRGDLGAKVTMHTLDFSGPGSDEPWDPTGIRILAAAGEKLDVMYCGFTRPFSSSEAAEWSAAFSG